MFVICVEAVIYLLLYNLHDSTFKIWSEIPFSENRYHIETSQLICNANQLTGFYMMWFFTGRCFRIDFIVGQSLKKFQNYFVDSGDYLRNHCLLLLAIAITTLRLKICDSHLTCKVAHKCLKVRERVEVVEWNRKRSPPFACCPVSYQCPWGKTLIEKNFKKRKKNQENKCICFFFLQKTIVQSRIKKVFIFWH